MRTTAFILLMSGILGSGSVSWADQPKEDVPGPFQVYCINGDRAGKFHCPVSEHRQSPMVLIFLRGGQAGDTLKPKVDLPDHFKRFLKRIDDLVDKHSFICLGSCAVFLNDGGYQEALKTKVDLNAKAADIPLGKAAAHKEKMEEVLKKLAEELKIKNMTFGLTSHKGPQTYAIKPDSEITIVFAHRLKIETRYEFTEGQKDPFTEEAADKIYKELAATFAKLDKRSSPQK